MPEINVIIDKDGNVHIDAIGFNGGECEKATEALERALGTVKKREKKKEFYNKEKDKNTSKSGLYIK